MLAITGGGTGGHLAIARAFANELKNLGHDVIFIGSTYGQDRAWFEKSNEFNRCYFLDSYGVVNRKGMAKIMSLGNILVLSIKAAKILKHHKIQAVISVGGYSAAPCSFGAIIAGIPLFIHEQNAVVGRLNSILRPFSKGFFSSYNKDSSWDYPVSDLFFQSARIRNKLQTILFLGGSQGANAINDLAIKLAPSLIEKNISIMHQCGKGRLDEVRDKYLQIGLDNNVEIFEFSDNMPSILNRADLAISRAGASSIWELVANNLPSILIPYPYAAANHQYLNAESLYKNNLFKICIQDGDSIKSCTVLKEINNIDLESISKRLATQLSPNGANLIIKTILKHIKKD